MKVKIDIPIYNFEIFLTDWKHAKQVDNGLTSECIGGMVYWCKGSLCMWISTAKKKYLSNLLCHESVHAAMEILGTVGVPADKDNQEALAYLTAYIRDEAEKILKKKGSKDAV